MSIEPPIHRPQFSLRSILVVTGGVAGLSALVFTPHPLLGVVADGYLILGDIAIGLLCCAIMGASVGHDIAPQRRGWLTGASLGALLGMILACLW